MGTNKIDKIILQQYNDKTNAWTVLYPKTSGDMVSGRVDDSLKFNGLTTDKFMPSTFSSFLEVIDENKTPQGLAANRIVVSTDYVNDEAKVTANQMFVKGKLFVLNGQEVATQNDVDKMISKTTTNILASKVNASRLADKLSAAPTINDVVFDGTKNINIQMYVVSNTPPTNTSKLWIDGDGVVNYYYNNKWNPCTAVWDEDK